ncbi:PD-(D/E)XK motif protein [Mesorhizobium sp. NBSH29]|uniref:PD-(D/E)XK motif protein n=1 Tax=Mesorhizobium sp. NBSH29 TaxID=2654249 RepID=UPI001896852E|nr:PD-(D/E)XK motif protein [Mesorhizobium sp. NBSH29]
MTGRFGKAYADLTAKGGRPSEASYLVVSLGDELDSWFVGMDDQQHPSILVQSESPSSRHPPPIRLENLDVQFHVPCKIEPAGGLIANAKCSVMRLNSTDPATRDVFFSVCDSIADMLGNSPQDNELSKAMRRLAAIFRRMLAAPTRTLSGLFGELCLIYQARLPHELIRDWRESDEARYDFSSNDLKVEVKSTSTRRRVHEFAFEQCTPPAGALGLVASIFVERAGRGTSIREIQSLIESRLTGRPDAILKLREVVAKTLGTAQCQADDVLFDLTLATGSIAFFDLREIPALRDDLPLNVSRVRFASDLSAITETNVEVISNSQPNLTAYTKNP